MSSTRPPAQVQPATSFVRRHVLFAWWSLVGFVTLGVALEAFHGLKVDWYLNTEYQTRRLMWTLGHAHGTLLALIHGGFAATAFWLDNKPVWLGRCSPMLMGASVLLPGGFLLGGIFIHDGDPGLGIFLVPVGALLLLAAVLGTALGVSREWEGPAAPPPAKPRPKKRN